MKKANKMLFLTDQYAHLRILEEIKQKLKKILKDNMKQIEQMNDETEFYQECRDLINDVFDRVPS